MVKVSNFHTVLLCKETTVEDESDFITDDRSPELSIKVTTYDVVDTVDTANKVSLTTK